MRVFSAEKGMTIISSTSFIPSWPGAGWHWKNPRMPFRNYEGRRLWLALSNLLTNAERKNRVWLGVLFSMKISDLYRRWMKITSCTSFNPQVGLVLTLEESTYASWELWRAQIIITSSPLVKMDLDLIFSLSKKSLEEIDQTIGLHIISYHFWLIRAWMFLASLLTNVKYFMTSNTVQKKFSSFPADLGFVRFTLTYESYLAHIKLDTWKGDQPVVGVIDFIISS